MLFTGQNFIGVKHMNKKTVFDILKRYSIATLGCVIYSLGVSLFLSPNNIFTGGVTGIALIIQHVSGWGAGLLIVIINIPMFILGAVFFGRNFTVSTLYSTLLSSFLIEVFDRLFADFLPLTESPLVAGVAGGVLFGAGVGLIFRVGSSTGGTDIIVKALRRRFRQLKTGEISLAVDIVIVSVGAIVYRNFEQGFWSATSLIAFMLMFDLVLYGGNSAKLIYIVPSMKDPTELCNTLMSEINTGATYLTGRGAYSGDDKQVILCVCRSGSYPKLRDVVRREDPKAFMIVSSAREIYGEGYTDPNAEEL